jgi:hypothetical protein
VFHFVTSPSAFSTQVSASVLKTRELRGFKRGRWVALYCMTTSVSFEFFELALLHRSAGTELETVSSGRSNGDVVSVV